MAAIASVFGLREAKNSSNTDSQVVFRSTQASNSRQSSRQQFIPWPWNGTIACAASPMSAAAPCACHFVAYTVPSNPIGLDFGDAIRHQPIDVGEVCTKKSFDRCRRHEGLETHRTALRQEQRRGKAAVRIGQRNQHEISARPDVQRVILHHVFTPRTRWDREFLVAVLETRLLGLDERERRHAMTGYRA